MFRAGSVGRRKIYDDEDGNAKCRMQLDIYDDVQWDEKGRTMISHIYVAFDEIIRSIQFGYLENEALVLGKKRGYSDSEGCNFRVVRLSQDEYVTGLTGVVPPNGGISNLTIHTNCGIHGPFGRSNDGNPIGTKIEIDPAICDRREFGGFFGSYSADFVSSIGIYVSPIVGPIARTDTVVKNENS